MIDQSSILKLRNAKPFLPFKIRMFDGSCFLADNPRRMVPLPSRIFLALDRTAWKLLEYKEMQSVDLASPAKSQN